MFEASIDEARLRVTEIFFSIQGESTFQGLPCGFIRLTGCNLRCVWCDSAYAFQGGELLPVPEIVERVTAFPTRLVELTGGEPLLQQATPTLAAELLSRGFTVLCETSGERDIDLLPEGVHRIMDLKAPGSGEVAANRWDNLEKLRPGDELKIVIADRGDFEWAAETLRGRGLLGRVPLLLSPVAGRLEPRTLAEWILASGLPARLNLQLHKQLWGDQPGR